AWSFIIGVLPLVFARGAGAGAMRGIGICTCCGMLAATVFGICFTPALYSLFERMRKTTLRRPRKAAVSGGL
ncbi:MAG: efflux RND transporter permease subunit, partial [Proteobacteria bacterium]|nr:efflux RND transporter permease subunit [Pseudomonadota bacterium]